MFLKGLLTGMVLLAVSCGKSSKKEDGVTQDIPGNPAAIKKVRKDVTLPGLAYGYAFNKDEETELEEVYASYEPDRFNQGDGSIILDGVSDYVTIQNQKNLNPKEAITISVWYKPESFVGNGNNFILCKEFTSYEPPFVQYALTVTGDKYPTIPGTFKFLLSIDGKFNDVLSPPNAWAPGEWYLLTGTYDGKKMSLYINNRLAGTRNIEGKIDAYNTVLLIGKTPHKDFYTSGSVDDLKIFNRALTREEIAKLYKNR